MSQEDIKVEVLVVGANRGGIIVSVDHIRGFIPGSHLTQVGHRAHVQHWIRRGLLLVAERCMQQQRPHGGLPSLILPQPDIRLLRLLTPMLRLCSQSTKNPAGKTPGSRGSPGAPHTASAAAPLRVSEGWLRIVHAGQALLRLLLVHLCNPPRTWRSWWARSLCGIAADISNSQAQPPEDLEELVGTKLMVKFLEVDEEQERVVFSARRAHSEAFTSGFKVSGSGSRRHPELADSSALHHMIPSVLPGSLCPALPPGGPDRITAAALGTPGFWGAPGKQQADVAIFNRAAPADAPSRIAARLSANVRRRVPAD